MPAKIKYNDKTIASVKAGQTAVLNIKGALPESNLVVDLSQMNEVITEPLLQEKTITENGEYTYDGGYDGLGKINVNVKLPDGCTVPSGNIDIVENGEYDVTQYKTASVSVTVPSSYVVQKIADLPADANDGSTAIVLSGV